MSLALCFQTTAILTGVPAPHSSIKATLESSTWAACMILRHLGCDDSSLCECKKAWFLIMPLGNCLFLPWEQTLRSHTLSCAIQPKPKQIILCVQRIDGLGGLQASVPWPTSKHLLKKWAKGTQYVLTSGCLEIMLEGDTSVKLQQGSEKLSPAPCTVLQAAAGRQGLQDTINKSYVTTPFLPSHFDWLQTQKTTEDLGAAEMAQVPCRSSSPFHCKNLYGATFQLPEDATKVHNRPFKPALLL